MAEPLGIDDLCWHCDPAQFDFETTNDLAEPDEIIGQPRVISAIRFAADMAYPGYNIFALGAPGLGKHSTADRFLRDRAGQRPVADDWCYVSTFDDSHRPGRLALPAGRGGALQHDMATFVEDCRLGLTNAFESEEYRTRRQVLEEEMSERNEQAIAEVEREAKENDIALVRTPMGFGLAPIKDGEIVKPDVFRRYPEEQRKSIEARIEAIQEKLRQALSHAPTWFKETRDKIRQLNEDTARFAVTGLVEALKRSYADLAEVVAYLDAAGADVIANAEAFLQAGQQQQQQGMPPAFDGSTGLFRRYRVNLLVDNSANEHAPVVYEDNPSYDRLLGSIEYRAEMGALTTDFTLIRPGSLHRANGGYLIVDARKLLTLPLAWEGLKQTLRNQEIRIEPMARALGLMSTQTLEPEPIPLDVKVVLVGEPLLYYLLSEYDPEFPDLFKVMADFDERIDRSSETQQAYARLIAGVVRRQSLLPFDRTAVARAMQQSARIADHREKFSANIGALSDLLREADYEARKASRKVVTDVDVEQAVDAATFRADRIRERMHEQIIEQTIMIDTQGACIGQINGLAVLGLGGFSFGRPSRITARVTLGRGDVVDIEREVKLGGPLHSKGMLILGGFLSAQYVTDLPLSLHASLVFEQSYGGVDGDSASSAELYCLLSAIAEVPIGQNFAVTGSVNQRGEVQAIGGVNQKIEGFFDICAARGLSGDQGVLIPQANVPHLMLHRRVRDAVAAGTFHVYPVATIDEGIERLTGMTAGTRQPDGTYPEGSFNRRVADRLRAMARRRIELGKEAGDGSNHGGGNGESAS
jgi:lon-related putative ATP-dependent protease